MSTVIQSINLHYTDGHRSDKVYNIELVEVSAGSYTVNGYNGRRGSTLTLQEKTPAPVTLPEAQRIFNEVLNSKVNHPRTPYSIVGRGGGGSRPSSSPTVVTQPAARSTSPTTFDSTGYTAQHPKRICEEEARRLLDNDFFVMEQKADGVFMALLYRSGKVAASNKLGKGIPAPPKLAAAIGELAHAAGCEAGLGLAGEYLDDQFHTFAVWEKNGVRLDKLPFGLRIGVKERLEAAYQNHLMATGKGGKQPLGFIHTAKTKDEKRALYATLKANSAEGVVFTHVETGQSFKEKWVQEVDVIVVANEQRSAECFVYCSGRLTSVGSVTCPTDAIHREIKEANARGEKKFARVKYLYATAPAAKGGKLYQPVFAGLREDIEESSCTGDDLKLTNKGIVTDASPNPEEKTPPAVPSSTNEDTPRVTATKEIPGPTAGDDPVGPRGSRRRMANPAGAGNPRVQTPSENPEPAACKPAEDSTPTLFLL